MTVAEFFDFVSLWTYYGILVLVAMIIFMLVTLAVAGLGAVLLAGLCEIWAWLKGQ